MDIFSTEFLENIRSQILAKPKNSKVLIEAIKELTQTNLSNKVRLEEMQKLISELQGQVALLKEENNMLMEIIESSRADWELRLQAKDKKIEKAIDIEAQLSSQNEAFRNEVEKLKEELKIYKNALVLTSSRISAKAQSYLDKSQAEIMSVNDLNAYLFTQKDLSDGSLTRRDFEPCLEVSIDKTESVTGPDRKKRKEDLKKITQNQILCSDILGGRWE